MWELAEADRDAAPSDGGTSFAACGKAATGSEARGIAAPRARRRLAAILAADVVGYARLIGRDDMGTVERLGSHRRELIEPVIAAHGGRVVKLMGDGTLCEFASVIAAVEAALALQRGMAEREAGLPEEARIRFRIGISLGDLIVEGDDLHGDGVNVAARLETLALPGGVVVSGTVHEQVAGKVAAGFVALGPVRLKNIERPVHAYRVVAADAAEAACRAVPAAERPAVAVMPFTNMSDDAQQEYFADGLTEDLIAALAAWRWFPVVGRHSTFAYKGRSPTIPQLASELGARYVVEGSVRRSGNRVRITAQLVDAATTHQLWAQRYDRELTDIFAVQDEITGRMATALATQLDRAERQRAACKSPGNHDAWESDALGFSGDRTRPPAETMPAMARLWARRRCRPLTRRP